MATIELDQMDKAFGRKVIFQKVRLAARAGECVAIKGKSGTGKSTLLNILVGLEVATTGSYLLNGIEMTRQSAQQKAQIRSNLIGYIPQQSPVISRLTVQENICIPIWVGNGKHSSEQIEYMMDLCDRLGMTSLLQQKAGKLSGGEIQRVGLIRALLKKPELIIADEPTGALDDDTATRVIQLLQELCQQGATAVIATHSQHVAYHCNRVLELTYDGLLDLA